MKLPRAEFTASLEFGQCSPIAADLRGTALSLMKNSQCRTKESLLVLGSGPDTQQRMSTIPISNLIELENGRNIQFKLAASRKEKSSPILGVVTRGDVFLPILYFQRRQDSDSCDYVQIYEEINDETIVVTPKDDKTRRSILEAAQQLVRVNPDLVEYRDLLDDIRDVVHGRMVEDLTSLIRNGVQKIKDSSEYRFNREAQIADIVLGIVDEKTWKTINKGYPANLSSILNALVYGIAINVFIRNPSLRGLNKGRVPGWNIPAVRQALVYETLKRTQVDTSLAPDDTKAVAFYDALEVEDRLTDQLGPPHSTSEKLISHLGILATQGPMHMIMPDFKYDEIETDMFFEAEVKRKGNKDSITVAQRPKKMDDRSPVYPFSNVEFIRTSKDQMLEQDDIEELELILGGILKANDVS